MGIWLGASFGASRRITRTAFHCRNTVRLFEAENCRCIGIERLVREGLPREATAARFHKRPDQDFSSVAALLVLTEANGTTDQPS
jgi:hypothetical protein